MSSETTPSSSALPPTGTRTSSDTLRLDGKETLSDSPSPKTAAATVSLSSQTGLANSSQLYKVVVQLLPLLEPGTDPSAITEIADTDDTFLRIRIKAFEALLGEFCSHCQSNEWYCFSRLYLKQRPLKQLALELRLSEERIMATVTEAVSAFRRHLDAQSNVRFLTCWGLSTLQLQSVSEAFPDVHLIVQSEPAASYPLLITAEVHENYLEWSEKLESADCEIPPVILLQTETLPVNPKLLLRVSGIVTRGKWTRLAELLACRHLMDSESTATDAAVFLQQSEATQLLSDGSAWLPPAFWRVCSLALQEHILACRTCRSAALNVLRQRAGRLTLLKSQLASADQMQLNSDAGSDYWQEDPYQSDFC